MSCKIAFLTTGFLIAALFPGAAGEPSGIVAEKNLTPHFAPPVKLGGIPLWNNADPKGPSGRFEKELSRIALEPMTRRSFPALPYLGSSLFESEPPTNTRLVVREIELYGDGPENLAREAKTTASAPGAEIRYPERANDGNASMRNISYSAPPRIRENQEGFYVFDFGRKRTLRHLVLKSGMPRSAEDSEYVQVASDFSLEMLENGVWKEIPGTALSANAEADRRLTFPPVSAKSVRLHIKGQSSVLKVSIKKFASFKIPGDKPFFLSCNASRLPYNCFENFTVDRTGYGEWRKEHPDFMGFYVAEWGWDFGNFARFSRRGDLTKQLKEYGASPFLIRRAKDMLAGMKTRKDAMKYFRAYYDAIRKHYFDDPSALFFIDCSLALSHYAMDWGCRTYAIETTASGYHRHQAQMYFIRGASRQFGVPWGWYIAVGMNGKNGYSDPDYIGKWSGGKAGGAGGISPSLNLRDRFLAWFAGASFVMNEVWPYAYCEKDGDGPWKLSPHGRAMKEWFDFTEKHPERGTAYAPVALGLQYDHFVSPINGGKIFGMLPQERGDLMTEALLRTAVPYKFGKGGQEWALSETLYGDIFDVIVPSTPKGPAPMDVLKNYRVLFLSGHFDPDRTFAERLTEYVRGGGTLVVNVKQLGKHLPESFTGVRPSGKNAPVVNPLRSPDGKSLFNTKLPYEFEKMELTGAESILNDAEGRSMIAVHSFGKGRVVVCSPDHLIQRDTGNPDTPTWAKWGRDMRFPFFSFLMDKITDGVLPVKVSGHVGYGVNIVKDGLLVYLYNNEGVHKTAETAQKLDPAKTVSVSIDLRKLKVEKAVELRSGKVLPVKENAVTVNVGPGDVGVVKLFIPGGVR